MKEIKNILVPTDFSNSSVNALNYAIEMAKVCHAEINVLHAYRLIEFESEDHRKNPSEFKRRLENDIQSKFNEISQGFPSASESVKCMAYVGFPEDVIEFYLAAQPTDLIVMGALGESRSNAQFGSTFNAVAMAVDLPVLAVPDDAVFNGWKKIFLTSEGLNTDTLQRKMTNYLTSQFNAEIEPIEIGKFVAETSMHHTPSSRIGDMLMVRPYEYKALQSKLNAPRHDKHKQQLKIPLLIDQ